MTPAGYAASSTGQVEHYSRCEFTTARIRISCSGTEKIASNNKD